MCVCFRETQRERDRSFNRGRNTSRTRLSHLFIWYVSVCGRVHVAYVLLFGCVFGWWWPDGLLTFVLCSPTTLQCSYECIHYDDSLTTKSPLYGQNWTVSGLKYTKNSNNGYVVAEMWLYLSVWSDFPGPWSFNGSVRTCRIQYTQCHFVSTQSAGCGSRVQVKVPFIRTHTRSIQSDLTHRSWCSFQP